MKKRRILIIVLLVGILITWKLVQDQTEVLDTIALQGKTMGHIPYSIKYIDAENRNFQLEIDSLLAAFNQSLSTYIPNSELSQLNRNDTINNMSPYLKYILETSAEIYTNSGGAYDPTVGPLVNAWGFGPTEKLTMDSAKVDSIMAFVGYNRVLFDETHVSKPAGFYLDFSASAKGYGVDIVTNFLTSQGIKNSMVEIGGEVSCQGKNLLGTVWKIGIEQPSMTASPGQLFATAFVKDQSLATSGNYRNYVQDNGVIISHTISPYTGYSVRQNLLSASVFAKNCTLADGYATACMVLGVDKALEMINKLDGVDAFLIYSDVNGVLRSVATKGVQAQVEVLD